MIMKFPNNPCGRTLRCFPLSQYNNDINLIATTEYALLPIIPPVSNISESFCQSLNNKIIHLNFWFSPIYLPTHKDGKFTIYWNSIEDSDAEKQRKIIVDALRKFQTERFLRLSKLKGLKNTSKYAAIQE